jgi:type IV pilus assembly protein PilO
VAAVTLDDIVKLSTPKKLGILAGVVLLIIAGFWFGLISAELEKKEKKTKEYNKLKVDLDSKKQVRQDPKEFEAKLDRLRKHLEVMKEQLPDKKEIPSLLKTISSLGKESGLRFELFQPRSEIVRDFYAEIPVQIKVRGSYHEVADFFNKVAMLDRIVNISDVVMGGAKESNDKMILTTTCLATTFRFIDKPITPEKKKGKKGKKRTRK